MGNSMRSNHHTATFFFIRNLVKMWCIIVFGIPDAPSISHTVIHLSSSNNMDTMSIEVLSFQWSSPFLKSFKPSSNYATVHCMMAACFKQISSNYWHCIFDFHICSLLFFRNMTLISFLVSFDAVWHFCTTLFSKNFLYV